MTTRAEQFVIFCEKQHLWGLNFKHSSIMSLGFVREEVVLPTSWAWAVSSHISNSVFQSQITCKYNHEAAVVL
jgi:hypothetical protein